MTSLRADVIHRTTDQRLTVFSGGAGYDVIDRMIELFVIRG